MVSVTLSGKHDGSCFERPCGNMELDIRAPGLDRSPLRSERGPDAAQSGGFSMAHNGQWWGFMAGRAMINNVNIQLGPLKREIFL